jgi:septal ring factor EnvC (AmiA/AmiB activator)
MSVADKAQEFSRLKAQIEENARRKIRLEEKLAAATAAMKKVVAEITEAGYDPKTLEVVKAEKEKQLAEMLRELTARVNEQTAALSAIEGSL